MANPVPYPYDVRPVMEGTQAVEIPVLAKGDLVAGEKLFQCAVVALDATSGLMYLAGTAHPAIYGIAMWDAAEGSACTVLVEGTGYVIASSGADIEYGDPVGFDAASSGFATTALAATSGDVYILGIAQTHSTWNKRVKVLIKPSVTLG